MKTIVVWFSCGAASAVAAKLTVDKYSKTHNVIVANTPIFEEHIDNRRFLNDVSKWIKHPIVEVVNHKAGTNSAVVIWDKRKYMSGTKGAPCTGVLKKEARYQFELEVNIDFHVLGFTADEKDRHDKFVKFERDNVIPILIENNLTKSDCFEYLNKCGIEIPEIYSLGFPNANCIGCVKATSPTYWNHVRRTFPEIFKERAEQSRLIKCRLVRYKGKRLFLDELPEEAKGNKMKTHECSIFCQTKP